MHTSTKQMQLDYWTGFREFVSRNGEWETASPYPQNFLVVVRSREIGRSGFTLEAAMNTKDIQIRVALELKGEDTAYYFDQLSRKRDAIEAELGDKMVWHAPFGRRRRSIQRLRSADPWSRTGRTEQYRWLLASVDAMHRVLVPRVRALRVPR